MCDLATAIPVVLASLRGKQRACRNCNVVTPVDKAKFDERSKKKIYIYENRGFVPLNGSVYPPISPVHI